MRGIFESNYIRINAQYFAYIYVVKYLYVVVGWQEYMRSNCLVLNPDLNWERSRVYRWLAKSKDGAGRKGYQFKEIERVRDLRCLVADDEIHKSTI